MTIYEVIKRSLRLINTIATGEEPTADESHDCLEALNGMLDAWNLENLMIYDIRTEEFPLVANIGVYTIGPGADFNTVRPLKIEQAIYHWDNIDYPLAIISKYDYENIPLKSNTANIPLYLYYEPSYTQGVIRFWPIPGISKNLKLVTMKQLSSVNLNDTVSFPPGYQDAITYNLAVAIAQEFATPNLSPVVIQKAMELKQRIKDMNEQQIIRTVKMDRAMTSNSKAGYSIFTDGYR